MIPEIMKAMGFEKEMEDVKKGICPFCKEQIKLTDFKDVSSAKEYCISGLCQACQDEVFEKERIQSLFLENKL